MEAQIPESSLEQPLLWNSLKTNVLNPFLNKIANKTYVDFDLLINCLCFSFNGNKLYHNLL